MTTNPFSPTTATTDDRGVFGDARRIRSGFLFREIEFDAPVACRLVYSGWWFVQRIWIDDRLVWRQISWLNILPRVEFALPGDASSRGVIEIDFGRGLMIRRFRVWLNGQIAYDEIN